MRHICTATFAALLVATTADAGAQQHTRYLELINRAHDSVTSLAIATTGGDAFQAMPLDNPLQGGGNSTTIQVAGDSCRYDLRVAFRNGRTVIYRDVDICRNDRLRIRQPRRAGGNG